MLDCNLPKDMSKMSELEIVITELRNTAANINDIADTLYKMFRGTKAQTKAEPERKLPTLEEVRAILAEKSRDGYTAEVRNLLQKYGANKLSEISQEYYPALLRDAEVLGNAD